MSITMTTVILFAVFGVLLFLGVPISISIVASSIVTAMSTLSWDQITFITMQKMNSGVESFSLLAVPLFILAVLGVLIAISRVVTGVHYISDVLAGLAFGSIFAVLGWNAFVLAASALGFYAIMLL